SSLFLLIIGIINLVTLIELFTVLRKKGKNKKIHEKKNLYTINRGVLTKIFKPFLKTINASWHMYPIGLLFGLGFDTASEIGLLSISATTSATGMPIGIILLLPFGFTAGMTLVDTIDGILMLGAYGWAYIDPLRKIYYNLIIVSISVAVAFLIGGIEGLQV